MNVPVTVKPVALHLDAITQVQLDTALRSQFRGAYSAPCILGAAMPEEFVSYLRNAPVPRSQRKPWMSDSTRLDACGIRILEDLGLVEITGLRLGYPSVTARAQAIQATFDGLKNDGFNADRFERLGRLLPYLKMPETAA